MKNIRTYSELTTLPTFEERFNYLRLDGAVCKETFGFDRYINQVFYRSQEWKRIRDLIIIRDNGCDLGVNGREIWGKIIVHHMNPISVDDIHSSTSHLLNPEYLVCVSLQTHNAIHYGDQNQLASTLVERSPNDTCPWKTQSKEVNDNDYV